MIRRILALSSLVAFTQACSSDEGNSGLDGEDALPCTVSEGDDGKSTIECPDGTSVTITDGKIGARGEDGGPGEEGDRGQDGIRGQKGDDGQAGEEGDPGDEGEPGSKGGPGENGDPGQIGQDGTPGTPGASGDPGKTCSVECSDEHTVRIFCEDGTEVLHTVALCGDPSPATLSVSEAHACQILPADGRLVCWGSDARQQLGNGAVGVDQLSGTLVDARSLPDGLSTTWEFVSAGGTQTCGITTAGAAYCWGRGAVATTSAPTAVDMSDLPPGTTWSMLTVATSGSTTCGITSEATGYCWGSGSSGQRGDGVASSTQPSPSPIDLSALPPGTSWSVLSAGQTHSCGITTDGAAYCWGSDGDGRLGNGRLLTSNQASPTPVDISFLPPGTTWSAISAGDEHTCGVTALGEAYCWGSDSSGQVGRNGVLGPADYPQLVDESALQPGTSWTRVSAGSEHTCGVATDGAAYCWGHGASGRLGAGTATDDQPRPVAVDLSAVSAGTKWVHVNAGGESSCGLTTHATVYCWGSDQDGRLGNGSITGDQPRPEQRVETMFGTLLDTTVVVGAMGDATNLELPMSLVSLKNGGEGLVVTAASSNEAVIASSNVTVSGTGTGRTASFAPTGRGTATITFTVTNSSGDQTAFPINYAASASIPDPSGRYHGHLSDASTAIDVGDGYMLLCDDESNSLFFHKQTESGPPVKVWDFVDDGSQLREAEADIEGAARVGDQVVWITSHGNARDGDAKEYRRVLFATTITGSGAETELAFSGRYGGGPGVKDDVASRGLWPDIINWDRAGGHGLGADHLGFFAATRDGVIPNAPSGFNIEALEFAADSTTGYLGFRAPTIDVGGTQHALIVPLVNILDLVDGVGAQSGRAQFGAPIFLDLAGRSIRAIRRNASFKYLISAGPPDNATPGVNDTWALYTWDGDPSHAPVLNRQLPDVDLLTGGTWESIATVPDPLVPGATFRLVSDSGDTNFYGTGATKDLNMALQKSYSQLFSLH